MSQSKQRGSYEQRKATAIALKEIEKVQKEVLDQSKKEDLKELVTLFLEQREFDRKSIKIGSHLVKTKK